MNSIKIIVYLLFQNNASDSIIAKIKILKLRINKMDKLKSYKIKNYF